MVTQDFEVGAAEADSGRTLPASDRTLVNLTAALRSATPANRRRVQERTISEYEARAFLSQTRQSKPLILKVPKSFVLDMRCTPPNIWNGFTCVDAANLVSYPPLAAN